MLRHKIFGVLLAVALATACTKKTPDSPVAVLEQYVSIATNAKSVDDKAKLVDLTTGTAKEDLLRMTEQDFTHQFIDLHYKMNSFKAKDLREENSGDVSVVYELDFEEHGVPGGGSEITSKKIAYLGKDESGHWKIKETKNVKSFIEKKDSVEILEASPPPATKP